MSKDLKKKFKDKTIIKLVQKGDKEAVDILRKNAVSLKEPVYIEALVAINTNESLDALKYIHGDAPIYKHTPWNDLIEQTLIKLGDYDSCNKIMFTEKSPNKKLAEEVVLRHPRWAEFLKKREYYLAIQFTGQKRSYAWLNQFSKYKWKEECKYISPEGIDYIIKEFERRIEEINKDEQYYMDTQIPGDATNYSWWELRDPLVELLEYLKELKKS